MGSFHTLVCGHFDKAMNTWTRLNEVRGELTDGIWGNRIRSTQVINHKTKHKTKEIEKQKSNNGKGFKNQRESNELHTISQPAFSQAKATGRWFLFLLVVQGVASQPALDTKWGVFSDLDEYLSIYVKACFRVTLISLSLLAVLSICYVYFRPQYHDRHMTRLLLDRKSPSSAQLADLVIQATLSYFSTAPSVLALLLSILPCDCKWTKEREKAEEWQEWQNPTRAPSLNRLQWARLTWIGRCAIYWTYLVAHLIRVQRWCTHLIGEKKGKKRRAKEEKRGEGRNEETRDKDKRQKEKQNKKGWHRDGGMENCQMRRASRMKTVNKKRVNQGQQAEKQSDKWWASRRPFCCVILRSCQASVTVSLCRPDKP